MKKCVSLLFLLTTSFTVYAQENVVKYWEYDINGKEGIACRYEQTRTSFILREVNR